MSLPVGLVRVDTASTRLARTEGLPRDIDGSVEPAQPGPGWWPDPLDPGTRHHSQQRDDSGQRVPNRSRSPRRQGPPLFLLSGVTGCSSSCTGRSRN